MTQRNHRHLRGFTAVLVASLFVAVAASPAIAAPIVQEDGVVEIGSVDPYTSGGGTSNTNTEGDGQGSGSSHDETCLINLFGSCLFNFEEDSEYEYDDETTTSWYYRAYENSTANGYYVNAMDETVFFRVDSGENSQESASGESGSVVDYSYDAYSNNLGYSEEHEDDTQAAWDNARSSERRVMSTNADGSANTDAGGADVDATREEGAESSSNNEQQTGSNYTYDEYFGVPLYEDEDSQNHYLSEYSERFWRRTEAGGSIWLVNPSEDGSTVEIVGLRMEKGEQSGSGSSEGENNAHSSTSIFGLTVWDESSHDDSQSEYAFFNEWAWLRVDLVDGTIDGDFEYDRGQESGSSESNEDYGYEVVGIPIWGETNEEEEWYEREWRDVTFSLDAADGSGVVVVEAWDEDSETYERTYQTWNPVGIPFGSEEETRTSYHSDGVGIGLDLGDGVFWLNGRYENTTSEEESDTDFILGSPIAHWGSGHSESRRGVDVGAGSDVVPVTAGAGWENASSHDDGSFGFGDSGDLEGNQTGDDFLSGYYENEHTSYGADADAAGVFVFEFYYEDGQDRFGGGLGGTELVGVERDYQEVGTSVGGDVYEPVQGGHLFTYSFEHEEKQNDYDVDLGGNDFGQFTYDTTHSAFSIVVLDGLVGAEGERSAGTLSGSFGEDEAEDTPLGDVPDGEDPIGSDLTDYDEGGEVAEFGWEQDEYTVSHGAGRLGQDGVDDGSVTVSAFLAYVEFADAVALIVGVATWCVDTGVDVPYSTVVGTLPGEAQGLAGTAIGLALLATCFGAPVFAPLFLASPCILLPIATGLAFVAVGTVAGILPAGGGELMTVAGTAQGAYGTVYDEAVGCIMLTLPREARNPQPLLWGLDPVEDAADTAISQVWGPYDTARARAWEVVDFIMAADGNVGPLGTLPEAPATPTGIPLPGWPGELPVPNPGVPGSVPLPGVPSPVTVPNGVFVPGVGYVPVPGPDDVPDAPAPPGLPDPSGLPLPPLPPA